MKVSQAPYKRLDIPALIGKLQSLTSKLENAANEYEAENVMMEYISLEREVMTTAALSSIRFTQNTADKFYNDEEEYYSAAMPQLEEKLNPFYKAMLHSPFRPYLEKKFGYVAFINAEIALKTISPEVLPMLQEENDLVNDYQKLLSSVMVNFRGEKIPVAKMGAYKTSADRLTRKEAFEAEGKAYLEHGEEFDAIYDKMVAVRTKIARTLGFDNFTPLGYLRMTRNCYDPTMVENFRRQVKETVVPLVCELKKKQAERLGIDHVALYDDTIMSISGNPDPISKDDELYRAGVEMYKELSPLTAEMIETMDSMGAFDLESRENKMSGGYTTVLPGLGTPFIFANFNGTSADVEVFTHEGGHAFASSIMLKDDHLLGLGEPTLESCEVHSMSMEFLCWPKLETFYANKSDKARLIHLIGALDFLPYGCMVDEFQHIVYDNPDMTPAQRHEAWARLEREYRPYLDFEDIPFYSAGRTWQRQLHIYTNPFYYIDYCLAQTVALEIWLVMIEEGWEAAWKKYMAYTLQGGSETFVGLVKKAGLVVPFDDGCLKRVAEAARKYVEENEELLR